MKMLEMRPVAPFYDLADHAGCDVVRGSDLSLCSCVGSDCNDFGVCQFGAAMGLPVVMAFLRLAVFHVVFLRTSEQVLQFVAGRIIAVMQDANARWNRAMSCSPGFAVDVDYFTVFPKLAVASRRSSARPDFARFHTSPYPGGMN